MFYPDNIPMLNRISGANDSQDENWIANDLKIIEEEQQFASDLYSTSLCTRVSNISPSRELVMYDGQYFVFVKLTFYL